MLYFSLVLNIAHVTVALIVSFPLPDGWEWATEWSVDIFGTFGAVDMDGWCYAVTWDGLNESIQENRSVGENSTSCLCRRRRWIRIRRCVSVEASSLVNDIVEEKLDVMVSLEKTLVDKTNDYENVMKYEKERKQIYDNVTSTCLADILVVYQTFVHYERVLKLLKSFLEEQAAFEKEYAENLGAHAAKFAALVKSLSDSSNISDVSKPISSPKPHKSASFAVYNSIGDAAPVSNVSNEVKQKNNEDEEGKERTSSSEQIVSMNESKATQSIDDISDRFFGTMNKFNNSASQKWSDLGNLIGSSVIEDVNDLLSQLTNEMDVTKRFVYWSDLNAAPILSKLESSIVLLQHTYFTSASRIKSKISKFENELFQGESGSSSSSSNENSLECSSGRRCSLKQRRSSIGLLTEGWVSPSSNFPLSSSVKVKVDDDVVVDMWICMKSYRKNVISLGNELSLLGLAAQKCTKKEKEYGQSIRHMFIASAQVLSHEKARICMEMGEIMNKDIKHFVSQVAEEQKQQVEENQSNQDSKPYGDATLVFTPATELPKFHNQILLMSIMQYSTLADARRVKNNDSSNKQGILSIKAVVTTDGVLHIFLLEDKEKKKGKNKEDDTPYRSLLLEKCKIVRHFEEKDKDKGSININSSYENAVEVHPRSVESEWFSSSKKNEAFMLIPIDSMESETWVDVLTNPALCGADMLYSALGGTPSNRRSSSVFKRRSSTSITSPSSLGDSKELADSLSSSTMSNSSATAHQEVIKPSGNVGEAIDTNKPFSNPSKMTTLFPSVDISDDESDSGAKFDVNSKSNADEEEFKC